MTQHKWHKEIIHWANGGEIQHKNIKGDKDWIKVSHPTWDAYMEYRIKPQPKEKKFLYVYKDSLGRVSVTDDDFTPTNWTFFGKIEVQDD